MIKIPDAKTARLATEKVNREYLDRRCEETIKDIEKNVTERISSGIFEARVKYEHELIYIGDMIRERIIPMVKKMGYKVFLIQNPFCEGSSVGHLCIIIEWGEEPKDNES